MNKSSVRQSGLSTSDFDFIRQFVLERSGIALDDNRRYLVESRLGPLARRQNFSGLAELVIRLRAQRRSPLATLVVEAMTTNETSFFRDLHPFEVLRARILPELLRQQSQLSIWCAACSTGQEPYSIAMLIQENFPSIRERGLKILATDISNEVLNKAKSGRYSQLEVNRGLPAKLLVRYFRRSGRHWDIANSLKSNIKFSQINLLESRISEQVDIVFLRNVLIYFKEHNKKKVLANVKRALKPRGYLFLGGAETIIGLDTSFETLRLGRTICYRLK